MHETSLRDRLLIALTVGFLAGGPVAAQKPATGHDQVKDVYSVLVGDSVASPKPPTTISPIIQKDADGWYFERPVPGARPRLPLHLRGSFNDWKAGTKLSLISPGRWQTEVMLPAGGHEFKIGDFRWVSIDLGAGDRTDLTLGSWLPLAERGGNIAVNLPKDGRYRFELQWDSPKGTARVKVVGPIEASGAAASAAGSSLASSAAPSTTAPAASAARP